MRAPSACILRLALALALPGATDADIERFRTWFYARARALPDTEVRNAQWIALHGGLAAR